jgi:1-deoxy-D-xylulose-5-phosphate reductoisomerase
VAVDAFIKGELAFTSIVQIVAAVAAQLDFLGDSHVRDISDVSAIEQDARQVARSLVLESR